MVMGGDSIPKGCGFESSVTVERAVISENRGPGFES